MMCGPVELLVALVDGPDGEDSNKDEHEDYDGPVELVIVAGAVMIFLVYVGEVLGGRVRGVRQQQV